MSLWGLMMILHPGAPGELKVVLNVIRQVQLRPENEWIIRSATMKFVPRPSRLF